MIQLCHACNKPTSLDPKGNLDFICVRCHNKFKDNNEGYLATHPAPINHICGVPQNPKERSAW